MTKLTATTWQTVGPFFSIGLGHLFDNDVAGEGATGERIQVEGRVLDGNDQAIVDCVLEVWQANAYGKYAHPDDTQDKPLEQSFSGFGRVPVDEHGVFRFTTIKPGSVPGPDATVQAPHLLFALTMRGLLRGLFTRAYFEDEPANAHDPILALVAPDRRGTLMMHSSDADPHRYEWTVRMQGEHETVFFEI